jgi:beta-glucanase (GH16 family)
MSIKHDLYNGEESMASLSYKQIKSSLIVAGLTAVLSACGGGSIDENASSATSSSSAPIMLAHENIVSQPAEASGQATDPDEGASQNSATSSASSSDGPTGQDPNAYTLTFQDNFDGDLDRSVWKTDRTETSNSTTNYATRNGTLKIWPERGRDGAFFDRTLDTDGRFSQRYGYFEIEAKLPKGKGVWPAFWLFNQIGDKRPEIDIMEAYPGGAAPWGAPGPDGVPVPMMYAPVVWTSSVDRAGYGKVATPDLSAGFHQYGLKWEENKATFYFDGREVYSLDVAISDPLYVILDLWFGSASGEPDETTPTGESNAFEVNYVRAWQFK